MYHMRLFLVLVIILSAGLVAADESIDCVYRAKGSKADQPGSTKEYKSCGTKAQGKVRLSKKHLRRVHYDSYGLATVFAQGQYYYVKPDGSMLPVVGCDNWADDYSEGLVRSAVDGKIAYFDRTFKQIIAPKYDWAAPFKNGRALVCSGCRTEIPDKEGHTVITGGVWGYINKKGQETIPVRYERKEAERM